MALTEDPKGAQTPHSEGSSEPNVAYSQTADDSYGYNDDAYSYAGVTQTSALTVTAPEPAALVKSGGGGGSTPPPKPPDDSGDDEEEGMLRMSFLEHLEELRARIIRMLMGVGIAFVASLTFSSQLWVIVSAPATYALRRLGYNPAELVQLGPMDVFNIVYVKLPILTSVFISSPWIVYQIWGFIAPGLYRRERRWAGPFVICTAGLFILGGLFAYFVAFRFGLEFLLGIGQGIGIHPFISIEYYFDLFVDVILGVALVFEMPVLIFFLTLLRIVTPKFLISQSRYAILIIVIIAAVVTPTPDVFNMMLFAVPMVMLFYVGILASYVLTLSREGRKFPWSKALYVAGVVALAVAGLIYFAITKYGYHWVKHWPFLMR